ncbi:MAG TPA: hypothetical protein VE338_07465 [Ktedonobacterales bacterium]|nr:hypothetical protein [Ktedonobacterales bacterium]
MPTVANGPNTLGVLQAMQSIIMNEALIGGVSPFAALSAGDATRYGVPRAVFIGRPKDFSDATLPCCCLWIPERDAPEQPVEVVGYAGRVFDDIEVTLQCFTDLRTDWYAAEQKILQIRDALWPVVLKHVMLGGTVATVTEADAYEGRGLCYEEIAGVEYRCYELVWAIRQQYTITGGVTA